MFDDNKTLDVNLVLAATISYNNINIILIYNYLVTKLINIINKH